MSEEQDKHLNRCSSEDIRAGYAAAVSIAAAEAATVWAKITAFIYAHTVLVLTLGLALGNTKLRLFATAVAVLGFVLCIVWHRVNQLGFGWYAYWLASARVLESSMALPHRTFERGKDLSDKGAVLLPIGEGALEVYLPTRPKTRRLAKAIVEAFAFLYVVVLIFLWWS